MASAAAIDPVNGRLITTLCGTCEVLSIRAVKQGSEPR